MESAYPCLLCQLEGSRRKDTPVAVSTPRGQNLVSTAILQKRNRGSLEKRQISDLGQGVDKMRPKHLGVQGSEGPISKSLPRVTEACKGHMGTNWKGSNSLRLGQCEQKIK